MRTDIVDNIKCYMQNAICDEAIIWRETNRFYIQYVGLGVTKRISRKQYEAIKEKGAV